MMALVLSLACLKHEIVENYVIFNCQKVHHVFKFKVLLIQTKQLRQLLIGVVQNIDQEGIQIDFDDGSVLLKDFHFFWFVLLSVLSGKHDAKIVDKRFDWHQPLVTFNEIYEKVKAIVVGHECARHDVAKGLRSLDRVRVDHSCSSERTSVLCSCIILVVGIKNIQITLRFFAQMCHYKLNVLSNLILPFF